MSANEIHLDYVSRSRTQCGFDSISTALVRSNRQFEEPILANNGLRRANEHDEFGILHRVHRIGHSFDIITPSIIIIII